MRKLTLIFVFWSLISTPIALAQQDSDNLAEDSVRDITMVAAAGGVGALLGLSTLSFVEKPKDHLKNIVVGGAIGIIIGVGIVAFLAANKSKGMYENNAWDYNTKEFSGIARSSVPPIFKSDSSPNQVQLGFSF